MAYKEFSLSNGLKVVYKPSNTVGVLAVDFEIRGGCLYEDQIGAPHGTAHFLEHVAANSMHKHLKQFSNSTEVMNWLNFSPATSMEKMQTQGDCNNGAQLLVEDLETFLLAVKGYLEPDIKEDVVESERKRILHEYGQKLNNKNFESYSRLVKILLGEKHPFADVCRGLGTEDSITSISKDDLEKFRSIYLTPDKVTLYLCGDIPNDLEAKIDGLFGKISPGTYTPKVELTKSRKLVRDKIKEHTGNYKDRAAVSLFFPIPSVFEEGNLESNVLVNILRKTLFDTVSMQNGLTYSPNVTIWDPSGEGRYPYACIEINTQPKNVKKVLNLVWKSIENLADGNIPESATRGIIHATKRSKILEEQSKNVANDLYRMKMELLGIKIEELYNKCLSLNETDIKKAAARYLPKRKDGYVLEYIQLPKKVEDKKDS